jgi:hypothetical protein
MSLACITGCSRKTRWGRGRSTPNRPRPYCAATLVSTRRKILLATACWAEHECYDGEYREWIYRIAERVLLGEEFLNRLICCFGAFEFTSQPTADGWVSFVLRDLFDPSITKQQQVSLIRDIFGNPFRPVHFSPSWRTPNVVGIAEGRYENRAFERLPILADGLMDAGCFHDDILNHCR